MNKSNVWLPLSGEQPDADDIRTFIVEQSLKVQMRHQSEPIFAELNNSFWRERFSRMSAKECRQTLEQLRVPFSPKENAEGLRAKLVNYFQLLSEKGIA